ncbi:dTDP-4-dehydrorhamnose 3,5-epimerase family protein [Candidatus Peregrinibacteria bacterium]|nr:dTDP-4-dehydrorhamnose 3,5-epimerase family protein [Candidatus Peregrinibacteria bacterium]
MFLKGIEQKLSKQDYAPKPAIDGVKLVELKEFVDDGGSFLELGRFEKGLLKRLPDFEVRQINYSVVLPGAVKATHIHKNQEDVWFVPPSDRVLVGLKDIRGKSATHGVTMRFVLGAGKPRLLLIPRGVAHGLANPWSKPATMIYFVNQHFSADAETCDEYRLDPYFFGKDFWNITHG